MNYRLGWFSVLIITTVSGLIVRVVGDPLVEMTSPKVEEIFEDIEDWLDDTQDTIHDRVEDIRKH
ncbi:MAG: hypothetical protein ACFE0J_04275 [Elainellaceae cyanobacterium]